MVCGLKNPIKKIDSNSHGSLFLLENGDLFASGETEIQSSNLPFHYSQSVKFASCTENEIEIQNADDIQQLSSTLKNTFLLKNGALYVKNQESKKWTFVKNNVKKIMTSGTHLFFE